MMTHLPEPVGDQEIMEMFSYADKDRDGRINFEEFLVILMIAMNTNLTPTFLYRP